MKTALSIVALLVLTLTGCGSEKSAGEAVHDHGKSSAGHDDTTMAGMSAHGDAAPTARISLAPSDSFRVGQTQSVRLTLTDLASGEPIGAEELAVTHTKKLHLLIIDESLSDYQHIHPVPDPARAGSWRFDFTPQLARTYRVWADVTRANGNQEYVAAELAAGTEAAPAPTTASMLNARADGLTFQLSFPKPLKVGEAVEGNIEIADAATGKPFAGLQPVMGAFGHIVAFAGDWDSIEHVHPLGAEPTTESARSGPTIRFHIQPEKAGVLKLFAQIQANGRETIVPFTTSVLP